MLLGILPTKNLYVLFLAKYTTEFDEFDQEEDMRYWAELREHFEIGDHFGVKISTMHNRKITLKVCKQKSEHG